MRNIELKARHTSLAEAESVAKRIGAKLDTTERQRDTYFRCPAGRLKLRERWWGAHGTAELIGYERSDADNPRPSDYARVPVPDAEALKQVLARALGLLVEVNKRRTVYLHENVRIHLDEVDDLGSFVEFEAVLDGTCDEPTAYARVKWLADVFGIAPSQIIPASYSDLLLRRS